MEPSIQTRGLAQVTGCPLSERQQVVDASDKEHVVCSVKFISVSHYAEPSFDQRALIVHRAWERSKMG